MNEMELLEKAIDIAVRAHRGQKDRYGAPYIQHPLRVMARVQAPAEKTVAILHDVIEDSDMTLKDLEREGFPGEVVEAVDCLTKRDGEPYEGRIERAASHPLARPVKLADLEDNMDLRRLPQLTEQDLQRLQRYHRGWKRLIGGNADCGINGFNSEEAKGLRKR